MQAPLHLGGHFLTLLLSLCSGSRPDTQDVHSLILVSLVVLLCHPEDASPQGWSVGRGRVTALGLLISLRSLPESSWLPVGSGCRGALLSWPRPPESCSCSEPSFLGGVGRGVVGLTPISRAGSHQTLLSNSSRSSVFKTSSKNHQERERQPRSFPLPTNSNGAGVMGSHQRSGAAAGLGGRALLSGPRVAAHSEAAGKGSLLL